MSADTQPGEQRRPKVRWLILGAAVTFAVLACAAAVVIVMLYRENMPLMMGAVTVAAVSLEVLLWTAAGVFGALAIANGGVPVDSVRSELAREMFDVADRITAEELEKAKNSWRAGTIFGRQRAADMAEAVQYAALYLGGPDAVNTEAARYAAVTLADIRRVAQTYLRAERSLTLVIAPEGR